jgi:hypothetical protein
VKPILIAALLAAMALAACGGDDDEVQRACSTGLPDSSAWEGGIYVNTSKGADGPVAVEEFNDFLADAESPVGTSPCDAARVFLHLDLRQQEEGTQFQVEATPGDSADADVEITLSRLPDDSILAERWNFTFEAAEGDAIRLEGVKRTQSCRPGRGHAAFTAEPCI